MKFVDAQDDVLWKAFEECGEIESVRIIRDERSGKGRGFGYVNFKVSSSYYLKIFTYCTALLKEIQLWVKMRTTAFAH